MDPGIKILIGVVMFVGCLLTLILVPLSFSYVEKNEMAFKKSTTSNEVDRSEVFGTGRYHWGLGHKPVAFPSTFQEVKLQLTVFTGGVEGGLEITLSIVFFYRLLPVSLPTIYERFNFHYHDNIVKISLAQLRTAASRIPLQQYSNDRKNVSDLLFNQLQTSLQAEAHVQVLRTYFSLQSVGLPSTILGQKENIFTTDQSLITANFTKQSTDIGLETDRLVQQIDNKADLVLKNATATSTRLVTDARSRAFEDVQKAKGEGLKFMMTTLGLSEQNVTQNLILYNMMLDNNRTTIISGLQQAIISP